MNREPGEKSNESNLHDELEALRREVADLRTRRAVAIPPQHATSSSDGGEPAVSDEIKAVVEELAHSIESGIAKRPVASVLGALLVGIVVGRTLSR